MKLSEYNEVRDVVRKSRSRRELKNYAKNYPGISLETFSSIFSQENQRTLKKTFSKHNTEEKMNFYYTQFYKKVGQKETHIIINMAREYGLTPCMLARMVLEVFLREIDTPRLIDPQLPKRKIIGEIFQYPYKLPDKHLATAVHEATIADDLYGFYPDRIRRAVGFEFEQKLKEWCTENSVDFLTEDEMRVKGYDKTPDVKLVVPVAVDGFTINWIESKAMFGDVECHTSHVKEQLGPYRHRFGPGLVIYWFGFIDALDCQRSGGIALTDTLPNTVHKIDFGLWELNTDWEFPKASHCEPRGHRF